MPDRRKRDPELSARTTQERVRQLDEDACAVALQRIGAGRTPMREVFENGKALAHDRVGFAALDVRDEAEAARIVLVPRIVEALRARGPRAGRLRKLAHGVTPRL